MKLETFNLLYALDVATGLIAGDREQYLSFTGQPYTVDAGILLAGNMPGPKWAIVSDEGRAVAVGGYAPVRPKVYHSWMMTRPQCWFPGTPVTALVREVIEGMFKNGARRLETVCLASREDACRWYKKIGLQYEATLSNYGVNGENAVSYVGVRT